MAAVHRKLGETDQEQEVLSQLARISPDAVDAYGRLMELGTGEQAWEQVVENGERYLAVYPMLSRVYEWLGQAAEKLGQSQRAIDSYQRLLLLDPADPVEVNYRLARLLRKDDPATARRHLLEALADAPRFRDGHRLLLEILADSEQSPAPAAEAVPSADQGGAQ
jgi:tetratricopeptide (TPR) repeat protein